MSTWVVDPLDGTTNYVHHHPVFAVSIGLMKQGDPLIGVIHVSRVANLGNALVGLDLGHPNEVRKRILFYLHQIASHCGTLRVLGSATLAMAYVAAGWLDAYFHIKCRKVIIFMEKNGYCVCPNCGERVSHQLGTPCYEQSYPKCGTAMTRE